MKKKSKIKLYKYLFIYLFQVLIILISLIVANYGNDIDEFITYCKSKPVFWVILFAITILITFFSSLSENLFYDKLFRLFYVKNIRKKLIELLDKIDYNLKKMEIEIDNSEINSEEYIRNFDESRSSIISRCSYEVDRGEVDHDSLHTVITALEKENIKEVIAISESPLNIWFITEMVCYLLVQMRISIQNKVKINRYIIGDLDIDYDKKFFPTELKYDEYGVVKKIHYPSMNLYVIYKNDLPISKDSLNTKTKSFLLIRNENGNNELEERCWNFKFSEQKFKNTFREINNNNKKQKIIQFIYDITNTDEDKIKKIV